MKSLIIKHFGEEEILAQITRSEDGHLVVVSDDDEARDHFSKLINTITTESPSLPLTGGKEEKEDENQISQITTSKTVSSTSEDYLDALWDYFNKTNQEYNGERIKVYTESNEQ